MPNRKSRKPMPSVSIIGAGRLGQAFAIALQSAGYPILALVARRRQKAEKASALLDATPAAIALGTNRLADLPLTDFTLIATPYDVIAETANRLAAFRTGREKGTVLHTSGALSSAVLTPLADVGLQTGSIH